jgi:hypothetical protein
VKQNIDKLDRYFWDCLPPAGASAFASQYISAAFKLKRLFEYASFPDLLKIPFDYVKTHIHQIDLTAFVLPGPELLFQSGCKRFYPKMKPGMKPSSKSPALRIDKKGEWHYIIIKRSTWNVMVC